MILDNLDLTKQVIKSSSYLKKIITLATNQNVLSPLLMYHMKWIAENLDQELALLIK